MSKTWIKVHIEFLDNPKIMTLNLSLRGVWFTALGIAERYDRDGLLPPADRFALMAHTDDETAEKAFAALAKKGLLDETPEGFRIHDWQDWQARKPSDEPEAVASRQAKWYANQKAKDLTRPNALGDVEQKPNAPNANTRARSEIKIKSQSETEKEGGGARANGVPASNGAHPPARAAPPPRLIAIPDPFRIPDEFWEWAEEHGYKTAWVKERIELYALQYHGSDVRRTAEEWIAKCQKWILDDATKPTKSMVHR